MLAVFLLLLASSASGTCPPGTTYNSQFNKCYQYVRDPADFLSAENSCESMGGSLVSISNAFENSFLAGMAWHISFNTEYWIGLDMLKSPNWSWINGDPSTYRDWAPGEPTDPSAYQCAAVRDQDNFWTKEFCNSTKPYMCQIASTDALTTRVPMNTPNPVQTSPVPGIGCPDGYCPTAGYTLNPATCKCYKYYDRSLNFSYNQSSVVCGQETATLAVILTAEDNAFVSNFTRHQNIPYQHNPWIGIWCTGYAADSCQWADGSPITYTNFTPGDPDANSPVYLDENNQMWYSFNYYGAGSFVCQQQGKWSRNEMNTANGQLRNQFQQKQI